MYLTLKYAHVVLVAASGAGFVARGLLMLRDAAVLRARWLRVTPHVVDTGLLATAIALVVVGGYDVLRTPWLTAKIGLLIAYIVIGSVALKRGRTHRVRALAFVMALAVFAALVATAITKRPLGIPA
jgi:uncharacterized membrane protein SirB2